MMQGDAYSVPVVIKAKDGTVVTPEMATRVEITIGSLSRQWPGVITFNEDTLAWEFPLTQQQSFRLSQGKQKTQVRVVFSNGWVVGGIGTDIRVLKSESRSVLPTSCQQAKSANMAFGAVYAEIGAMTVILGAGLPDISDATKGQYLTNDGVAPTWATLPTTLKKYSATNSELTASGGAFTWSITAATHGISNPMTVQMFEAATGVMVIADVTVTATGVTITINDTTSAGTLDAGTYIVVIVG